MDFSGKTVVVTGAASGMGRAAAIGFGEAGANVALVDVNVDAAQLVANQIEAGGAEASVYGVDVAEPAEMSATLDTVYQRYGRLDAVANVAAIFPQSGVFDTTEEFWDRVLSIDLRGASSAVRPRCGSWCRRVTAPLLTCRRVRPSDRCRVTWCTRQPRREWSA